MIARFDLQHRHRSPRTVNAARHKRQAGATELCLIGILTVLFVGWLAYRTIFAPNWVPSLSPFLRELFRLLELSGGLTLAAVWGILVWRQRLAATSAEPAMVRADLYDLSPVDFERYVARLFRRKGFQVKLRGKSGDHGVDLELRKPGGKRAIVQCKRYRSQIGPDVARELYGTLIHERAAHAFLVTTADISQATRDWVRGKPITLIDGNTLLDVATKLETEEMW